MTNSPNWRDEITSIIESSVHLINNPEMSDVVFTCVDKLGVRRDLYAHRLILAMRSRVFNKEIGLFKSNNKHIIEIDDYSFEIMLLFVRYLYSDPDFVIPQQHVFDLLNLGERYGVVTLVEKCRNEISNIKLTVNNICEYLEYALKVDDDQLKTKASDFIGTYGKIILAAETFKKLSPDALKMILARDRPIVAVTEKEIFESVMKWAEFRCELNNYTVNPINSRRSLGDSIKMVRFTGMGPIEFAECAQQYKGVLSAEEESSIAFDIIRRRSEGNEHGFMKPREELLPKLSREDTLKIGYGPEAWKSRPAFQNRFSINREIFVTQIGCAGSYSNQNIRLILGKVDGNTVIYKSSTRSNKASTNFIFKQPLQLLPGVKYFIDFKFESSIDMFFARSLKECPFVQNRGDVVISFIKWSPLFTFISFKKRIGD